MDASREDHHRVSVDTIQDWQRIRLNFRQAVESIMNEHLAANGVVSEKNVFLAHTNQVAVRSIVYRRILTLPSSLIAPLQSQSPTYA